MNNLAVMGAAALPLAAAYAYIIGRFLVRLILAFYSLFKDRHA